jgi:hypothetical protein
LKGASPRPEKRADIAKKAAVKQRGIFPNTVFRRRYPLRLMPAKAGIQTNSPLSRGRTVVAGSQTPSLVFIIGAGYAVIHFRRSASGDADQTPPDHKGRDFGI